MIVVILDVTIVITSVVIMNVQCQQVIISIHIAVISCYDNDGYYYSDSFLSYSLTRILITIFVFVLTVFGAVHG